MALAIGGVVIATAMVPLIGNSTFVANPFTPVGASWIDVPAEQRMYFEDFNQTWDDHSIFLVGEGVTCIRNGVTATGPFLASDSLNESECTLAGQPYDPIQTRFEFILDVASGVTLNSNVVIGQTEFTLTGTGCYSTSYNTNGTRTDPVWNNLNEIYVRSVDSAAKTFSLWSDSTCTTAITPTVAQDVANNGAASIEIELRDAETNVRKGAVPIGFEINFFGSLYDDLWPNTNGGIFVDAPSSRYDRSMFDLIENAKSSSMFALGMDLYHDNDESNFWVANTTVDGAPAFVMAWEEYDECCESATPDDQIASFQMVLIDVGGGDFNAYFNFDKLENIDEGYDAPLYYIDLATGVTVGSNVFTAEYTSELRAGCWDVDSTSWITASGGDVTDQTMRNNTGDLHMQLESAESNTISLWKDTMCSVPLESTVVQDIETNKYAYLKMRPDFDWDARANLATDVTIGSNIYTLRTPTLFPGSGCTALSSTFTNYDNTLTDSTFSNLNAIHIQLVNQANSTFSLWTDNACQTPLSPAALQNVAQDGEATLVALIGVDNYEAAAIGWGTYNQANGQITTTELLANIDKEALFTGGSNPIVAQSLNTSVVGRFVIGQRGGGTVVEEVSAPRTAPASNTTPVVLEVNPKRVTVPREIITLTGARLKNFKEIRVGGIVVEVFSKGENRISFYAPAGLKGWQDMEIVSTSETITMAKALRFMSLADANGNPRLITRGYAAMSNELTPAMKRNVRTFLNENSEVTTLRCTGYTSLPRATGDKKLAKARGKAACDYAKSLKPALIVEIQPGIEDPRPGSQIRRAKLVGLTD